MMVSDTEEKADETVSSGSINDNTDRLGFA